MRRHAEFVRVAGLLLAMATVFSGFLGALGVLFHLHGDKAPGVVEDSFRGALAVCGLSVVALVAFIRTHHGDGWVAYRPDIFGIRRRRSARAARLQMLESRRRLQRLAADPATQAYAFLVAQGQQWTDAQIAYDRDPELLVTCVHLQPIERAIRRAGIAIRPIAFAAHRVDARCCIDMAALQTGFGVAHPVVYATIRGDRPHDPDSVSLCCREHGASIALVHPDDAGRETPWFPTADADVGH